MQLYRAGSAAQFTNLTGIFPEVYYVLQRTLGWNFKLALSPERTWGILQEDGETWIGMIGMLQRKEADMGLSTFSITAARSKAADFSPAIDIEKCALFVIHPGIGIDWQPYVKEFSNMVWLAMAIFSLILVLTFKIYHKWDEWDNEQSHNDRFSHHELT